MSDTEIDNKRRRFLIKATSTVGTVGLGAIVIPFISSLTPSARALAVIDLKWLRQIWALIGRVDSIAHVMVHDLILRVA